MGTVTKRIAVMIAAISLAFCSVVGFAYPNTADADPGDSYMVAVEVNPGGGGTVSINGEISPGTSTFYTEGEQLKLDAKPASGWEFVNWTVGDSVVSETPSFMYEVTERASVKANFVMSQPSVQSYIISVGVQSNGMGTVSINNGTYGLGGTSAYDDGDTIALSAKAANGFQFVKWTADGNTVSTDPDFDYVVEGKVSLLAVFEKAPESYMVNIGIHSNGMGNITINGNSQTGLSGYYDEGTEFELTAEAVEGFRFVNWTNGDEVVSTDPNFTYKVEGRTDLYANFEKVDAVVTDPDDPSGSSVDSKDSVVTDPSDENKDGGNDKSKLDEEQDKSAHSEKSTESDKDNSKAKSDDSDKKLPKTADSSMYALGALSFVGLASLVLALVAARKRA